MIGWRLVLTGKTEVATAAHAALLDSTRALCGRKVVAEAGKIFDPVSRDDVTCKICQRVLERFAQQAAREARRAQEEKRRARQKERDELQKKLGITPQPKRK